MTPHELLDAVSAAGWKVVVGGDGTPVLRKKHPEIGSLPAELVAALKERRDEVLNVLCGCELCGRTVAGREMEERMRDPAFCTQGGAFPVRKNGLVVAPAVPRCPYKRAE